MAATVHTNATRVSTTTPSNLEFPALFDQLRGQFTIQRELGRGGMRVVYLARDEKLERSAAIKVLPAQLEDSAETRERFLREARIAAQLSHPSRSRKRRRK